MGDDSLKKRDVESIARGLVSEFLSVRSEIRDEIVIYGKDINNSLKLLTGVQREIHRTRKKILTRMVFSEIDPRRNGEYTIDSSAYF